jgi:hypothetical protein
MLVSALRSSRALMTRLRSIGLASSAVLLSECVDFEPKEGKKGPRAARGVSSVEGLTDWTQWADNVLVF